MDLGHARHVSSGSGRTSISSMSDDERTRNPRGLSRASSRQHILSPPLPESIWSPPLPQSGRTASISSFPKLQAGSSSYEYEGASMSELPSERLRKRRRGLTMLTIPNIKRPKWLAWFRQKYWAYDVLGLIGSLLLFLILVALLARFDKASYTDWHFGITLNAMVSLLVTLMGLCLNVPVATCLGQLKWNHYRRHGSKLRNFDLHDQASRTAWGSAKLLAKRPTHVHGSLAAFIMIAIHAIAPFVQQIIALQNVDANPYHVTVPVALSYVEHGDSSLPIDQLTQFAVYDSLYTLVGGVFPVYPTGLNYSSNSTYPLYASLGLSSDCTDISDKVAIKSMNYQNQPNSFFKVENFDLELPNGHSFQSAASEGKLDSFSITADHDSIVFQNKGNVVVDFTSIYVPPVKRDYTGDVKPIATECMIQFAGYPLTAYSLAGAANPGPFIEYFSHDGKVVVDNSEAAQKSSPWQSYLKGVKNPGAATDNTMTCTNVTVPTEPGQTQNIGTCYQGTSRLAKFLALTLKGKTSAYTDGNRILSNGSANGQSDLISSIASVIGGPPETARPGFDIALMINGTAMSLANNMRTASPDADRQTVQGNAKGTQLVYIIHWEWATVPVLLMILTAGLLAWTIIDTRRKNLSVWGTSCFADLIHGLDDYTRSTLMGIDEVEQLEQASEKIRVFLRPSDRVLSAIDTGPLSGTTVEFAPIPDRGREQSKPFGFGDNHAYQQI